MHDIYKQKCLVKSIYLVLQIKHCKKVHSSIGWDTKWQIFWSNIEQYFKLNLFSGLGEFRVTKFDFRLVMSLNENL